MQKQEILQKFPTTLIHNQVGHSAVFWNQDWPKSSLLEMQTAKVLKYCIAEVSN